MNSISKKVYIDKVYHITNEYNKACHRTTKMKLLILKIIHILTQLI